MRSDRRAKGSTIAGVAAQHGSVLRRGAAVLIVVLTVCGPHAASSATTDRESQAYLEDAQEKIASGELRAAVIQLKNALQRDANNAEARHLLGSVYVRLGDGASAEKELAKAESLGIARSAVITDLGRAFLLQSKFQQLLDELQLPAPGAAERGEVLLLRGDAQLSQSAPVAARDSYGQARDALPEDARPLVGLARVSMATAAYEEAEALVGSALEISPTSVQALVLKAELRRVANDLEGARAHFARAVELTPDYPPARLGLASAQIALGSDDEALKTLAAVDERTADHPISAYLHAVILTRRGETGSALARLENLGSAIDSYPPALRLRGAIRYEQNQLDLAVADLRVVLRRTTGDPPTRKLLAAALLRLSKPDEALELLSAAEVAADDDPQAAALLGTAYLQKGESAKGLEHLERALSANPDHPDLLRQLAIGSLVAGDSTRAVEALESSLDLGADRLSTGLLLGLAELNRGNPEEALEAARAVQRDYPESPIGWNLAGGALLSQGKRQEAREAFLSAIEADEGFLPARVNLAQVALLEGEHARAREQYQDILRRDDGNVRGHLGLAQVALAVNDPEAAVAELDAAKAIQLETAPEGLPETAGLYQAAGAGDRALEILRAARRRAPASPRILLALAQLQAARTSYGEAVASYEALLAMEPVSAPVHAELGRTYLLSEQPEAARRSLRRALDLDPHLIPAYQTLAHLELGQAGLDAALEVALELREQKPKGSDADVLTGGIYLADGKADDALAAFEAGWQKEKSQSAAWGRYQANLLAGARPAAVSALRDWLAENPSDHGFRMQLAASLLQSGDRIGAIEQYEAVLEAQPRNAVLLNNLAYLYLEQGDERALDLAKRAHRLAPESPEIKDTLGWILVQRGSAQEALPLLESAASQRPDQPDIAYHRAVALDATGKPSEARTALEALLKDRDTFDSRSDAEALLRRLSSP